MTELTSASLALQCLTIRRPPGSTEQRRSSPQPSARSPTPRACVTLIEPAENADTDLEIRRAVAAIADFPPWTNHNPDGGHTCLDLPTRAKRPLGSADGPTIEATYSNYASSRPRRGARRLLLRDYPGPRDDSRIAGCGRIPTDPPGRVPRTSPREAVTSTLRPPDTPFVLRDCRRTRAAYYQHPWTSWPPHRPA